MSLEVALVTARAARGLDEDEPPLHLALQNLHCSVRSVEWDDPNVNWGDFDVALLRSAWDYAERITEFIAWVERASEQTRVLNPLPVVRWNTDKHYLAELGRAGVRTVPSVFVEPGADAAQSVRQFLKSHPQPELVVKPGIGAGSRDAQRHKREDLDTAVAHVQRLLDDKRSVLLQPYLAGVDRDGETALMYFEGTFSHAIRKGPLLPPGGAATTGLFAAETITPRVPGEDEILLADRILAAVPFEAPLYARIDLIRDDEGRPCLLELEMTEPSLFFTHAAGSADLFAAAVLRRVSQQG